MPWDENKRIKINILRQQVRAQNLVVEFEVDEPHRAGFQTALEYFLAACVNAEATIEKMIEVTDGDSGVPTALEIEIKGFQEKLKTVLHQHMGPLQQNSLRSR